MPESLTRRHLLARSSAAGFFMIAGQWLWLTPREAEARAFEPQILSPEPVSYTHLTLPTKA